MRSILACVLVSVALSACGGNNAADDAPPAVCGDGKDNDGDGTTDFPEDLGCTSETDDTEDSMTSAQCMDGRDNDGDGRRDYPADPGCFAPQADSETDDCPTGPNCPQCADGKDNDSSGATDYPDDPGCTSASDDDEFLHNPVACGAGLMVLPLPTTGMVSGTLASTSLSMIASPCGGGGGAPAFAYELHLTEPKVVEVSTDTSATTADTVVDIRSEMCSGDPAHLACNDDISSSNKRSKVTVSLPAGDYYVIVEGQDSSVSGPFEMQVKTYAGEGATCALPADCGPGLVCRVPLGMSAMVCSKPMCSDGVNDDGVNDGADYPMDPGCTSPADNDEADNCPNGANCPECGDGRDNDMDGKTDYPMDTTCLAAGDSSESCTTTDGVTLLTMPMTMGDTMGANNDVMPTCGTTVGHTSPDRTYRLDVPALSSLSIGVASVFSNATVLYNSTCGGTAVSCKSFSSASSPMVTTALAAGTYYFVVDGYSTGLGTYTITTAGKIQNGASCESMLAQSGALTCATGYTCKGTMGSRTCQPGLCGDGIDNDGDTKIDYPFDPGCDSLGDDTEANPNPLPVCGNTLDDDGDMLFDWPNDYGCTAASGTSEVFCAPELDPTALITSSVTMGTTVGKMNNFTTTTGCTSSVAGPDVAYALSLPVAVETLVVDTIGSGAGFDTVLAIKDPTCATEVGCNDDGAGVDSKSKITLTNVQAGNYAIIVDGYGFSSGSSGTVTLNVKGTVASGVSCSSPLFSGGATAILSCAAGLSCTGAPARCQ